MTLITDVSSGALMPVIQDYEEYGQVRIWENSKVTLLAHSSAALDLATKSHFVGLSSDAEKVVEFAGRLCYMSHHNLSKKTTEEYIRNILTQGHGSVLEHGVATLLFEGVSRSLTHELVRHRAGFSYSQLSQRYVGAEFVTFVTPPLLLLEGYEGEYSVAKIAWLHALKTYRAMTDNLSLAVIDGESSRTETRKRVQQTSRNVLPNATETKIVVTANFRAWRHFLELRGSMHADPEIRRLAINVYRIFAPRFPAVFGDFKIVQQNSGRVRDGEGFFLSCEYSKV